MKVYVVLERQGNSILNRDVFKGVYATREAADTAVKLLRSQIYSHFDRYYIYEEELSDI